MAVDIKVEIQGNDVVSKRFRDASKDIPSALDRTIAKVSLLVERFGKYYSPVKTGLMRSTIYPVMKGKLVAWVGAKTSYAKYVHARVPFMYAAAAQARPSVQSILKTEVKKSLKK